MASRAEAGGSPPCGDAALDPTPPGFGGPSPAPHGFRLHSIRRSWRCCPIERIPAHLRLPDSVKEVEVRACGQERIIAPLGRSWDSFFQGGPTVLEDLLEERASQQQGERESF